MHEGAELIRTFSCDRCRQPIARLWRAPSGRRNYETVTCLCEYDHAFMGTSPADERANTIRQAAS